MAGIGDLIGILLQGGMTGSGANRVNNSLGPAGLGGTGGLLEQALGGKGGNDVLGGLLGAAKGTLGDTGKAVKDNPLAAGGLGALAGALLGGGSGSVKGALGGGALAMLAGLAFKALSNASTAGTGGGAQRSFSGDELPLGLRGPADAQEAKALEQSARLMLKGMINAAKADGQIDQTETQRLLGKLRAAGADADLQRWVEEELRRPLDLDGLVDAIPNQQVAAQVYAASLFAIEVDTEAERDYLEQLASGCGLDSQVVKALQTAVGLA